MGLSLEYRPVFKGNLITAVTKMGFLVRRRPEGEAKSNDSVIITNQNSLGYSPVLKGKSRN
jgi:hypothetical protein